MYIRTCEQCGVRFEAPTERARFCCPAHRAKWNRDKKKSAKKQVDVVLPAKPQPLPKPANDSVLMVLVQTQNEELRDLRERIRLLEQEVKALKVENASLKAGTPQQQAPAQHKTMQATMPRYDDDDLPEVTVKKATGEDNSSQNFLNSLMALQG